MTDYIVNIRDEELNESHIKLYDHLKETLWSFTEPAYFGEDLHPAIRFKGFELRRVADLKIGSQDNRAGGRSEEYKDVQTSIYTKGYKLKYLPPAILESPLLDKGRATMTGDTRFEVFDVFDKEWIIGRLHHQSDGWHIRYRVIRILTIDKCGKTENGRQEKVSLHGASLIN